MRAMVWDVTFFRSLGFFNADSALDAFVGLGFHALSTQRITNHEHELTHDPNVDP